MLEHERLDNDMLAQLEELLGDRFPELVERFMVDGQRRLGLIQAAVAEQDFKVIHAEAHGLKGSSRNVGANRLGVFCDELEELGRIEQAHGISTTLADIEQEFAAVCMQLRAQVP